MLTQVDRLQVAVADRRDAVECYERLFDALKLKEDRVACLGAERTVLRLGSSEVEVLEPDGVGRVADFLGRSGPGLFAAGFATPDPQKLVAHLRGLGRSVEQEAGQLFLSERSLREGCGGLTLRCVGGRGGSDFGRSRHLSRGIGHSNSPSRLCLRPGPSLPDPDRTRRHVGAASGPGTAGVTRNV